MAEEVRVWEVAEGDELKKVDHCKLDLEARIEDWIERDISVLDQKLLVIGRQVPTAFGKIIDLLCIDEDGNLVIVELKRDKTPHEVVAQLLDYASWVEDLTADEIREIADQYLKQHKETDLESAFRKKFDTELPEVINDHHAMLVVASEIDDSTERIIHYLSKNDVDINAVRFQFFQKADHHQLLVRTFTVPPGQAPPKHGKRTVPTAKEMEQRAIEAGVGEQYRQVKQAFTPYFRTINTNNTCVFYAKFTEGLRATFSLVPGESNAEKGLRYTVASKRLADFIGLDENTTLKQFPPHREQIEPYRSDGPTCDCWAGYIKSEDDVHRIASLLKKAPRSDVEQAA